LVFFAAESSRRNLLSGHMLCHRDDMPERSRIKRNPHAVALGRRGGLAGGKARAKRLSADERSAIARVAANARWGTGSAEVVAKGKPTRERIILAARTEFLRRGLDASRLDRIARAARVNKRMIYYYFGSKDGLFREWLRRSTGLMMQIAVTGQASSLGDDLVIWDEVMRSRPQWLRLSMWEAISAPSNWVAARERGDFWRGVVRDVQAQQAAGVLPDVDAAQLQLALMAVIMFPYLLPQLAQFVTGTAVTSDEFIASHATFLRDFASLLKRGTDERVP
jgi:AcrR family transcriptional regulator